ncbi:G-box-binding factor 3-like [Raphanus sativus]|uniref:G-box-binding factor 3-like n=1 Tax=Raphanus sativus TaxID=3726 RepID=A0A9W3D9G8_RAPSA|nr:G-box-binding factor 3-like [Raphanus sativus]XP_056860452.1 G-box-binding factor 3-like [Raphanus sativus]
MSSQCLWEMVILLKMNVKRSRNSSETDGSTDGSDGNTTGVIMSLVVVVPFCFHLHCEKPKPQMGPRLQNERELKRERRKQSNRESARRSRLRKQAETEELGRKVEALTAENMVLRSELNQRNEKSDKLRGANATLLNKLKSSEPEKSVSGNKNSGTGDNESNSTSKLHQLLDTKPRADAVAVAAG